MKNSHTLPHKPGNIKQKPDIPNILLIIIWFCANTQYIDTFYIYVPSPSLENKQKWIILKECSRYCSTENKFAG